MPVLRNKGHRINLIVPSYWAYGIYFIRRTILRQNVLLLPPLPEGPRLHVGAGQNIIKGYENIDAYDNTNRPDYFPTQVEQFIRAEVLDTVYQPESVAEIRCHHMFEHINILDVDRTLRS